jgi:hypothetical protein
MKEPGLIEIADAQITYRNFAGREMEYNQEGDRNFSILLNDDLADALAADGWNVKQMKLRDGQITPQKHLPVSIKYRNRDGSKARTPPTMIYITSRGQTPLGEDEVEMFDYIDIARVDVSVRPYVWDMHGKQGVKAYVKELYITAEESQLSLRYRNVPKVALDGAPLEITEGAGDDVVDAEAWYEDDPKELEA